MKNKPLTISAMMTLSIIPFGGNILEQYKNTVMSKDMIYEEEGTEREHNYIFTGGAEATFQGLLPSKQDIIDNKHSVQQQLCDDGLLCCYDYLLVMGCE